jgi:hypothetical protein
MPGFSVVFHPDAVEEAQAARRWYAERSQFFKGVDSPQSPTAGNFQ